MFHKARYLIKQSLREFIKQELLRDGNYDNVSSGQLFYDGTDISILLPNTNPSHLAQLGLQPGQIWQSAFRNWVYDAPSQINPSVILDDWPLPFRASGVYIDGAFRLENDPIYPHTIDYINGRVIFDNPLPLDKTVNAEFTYNTVEVLGLREYNNQFKTGVFSTVYKSNPRTAGQLLYPSGNIIPLPIIFIEDMAREISNYQLGDRSLILEDKINYEIWALDEGTRDNLIDLVTYQQRKYFPILNYNIVPVPLSGLKNGLSSDFIPYNSLARNNLLPGPRYSGLPPVAFKGYFEETSLVDLESFFDEDPQSESFEKAVISQTVRVYTIMPTMPFGLLEFIDRDLFN